MRILLVEDHKDVARPVLAMLQQDRYEVVWVKNAEQAYAQLAEVEPDLLVLDVMLPEGEDAGFELAHRLRETGYIKPILFLTARDAVDDRVAGLDLGGDDYLTKPFDIQEFMARVRALLRREGQTKNSFLERGLLRVNFALRRVYWDRREVVLTEKEFALLELLALHPQRVYRLEELVERLFPHAEAGAHTVRMYVMRLRDKLSVEAVQTVPGGYCLGLSE